METLAEPPAEPPQATASAGKPPVIPARRGWRMIVFYGLAILLATVATLLFADLLWRFGWSRSRTVLLVLYAVLFLLTSVACMHAIFGFFLRRTRDVKRITMLADYESVPIRGVPTALVFPVYNENEQQVCGRVEAMHESLRELGCADDFTFFILSDSTNPDRWAGEEAVWFDTAQRLGAVGRIFYRHRSNNEGKKSGNIRDFLSRWGRNYRYFICMDADSCMTGTTIVKLVQLMERHPSAGIIQTAPALINARSAYGRIQQFANRLYSPVFTAGLNFWTQDHGNYWGHNAIIRTDPFMRFCDLPQLPGHSEKKDSILSHDFIEAALLARENWQVWLAADLEGSYEEGPPDILENAQRDRRWSKGNLQHIALLFARGLRGVSRLHLTFGIFGYLASPLWLAFMLTGTFILGYRKYSGLSDVVTASSTPLLPLSPEAHALLVFAFSMTVIFLPKILCLVELLLDRARAESFGGLGRALGSALIETLFSMLNAPVQMLFHTKFVVLGLLGVNTGWNSQNRASGGVPWSAAVRQHWFHTLIGLGWGALTWWLEPMAFAWMLPITAGLTFSVPLTVITSRESVGLRLRAAGLLATPEEVDAPEDLKRLERVQDRAGRHTPTQKGFIAAILDPYTNAIHVSLLRENPSGTSGLVPESVASRLLHEGPGAVTDEERTQVLNDSELLSKLHSQIWRLPETELAPEWSAAIRRYTA